MPHELSIFISYAKKDLYRIAPLAQALEARGWSVFWDRTIPAGKTWRQVIGEALDTARCVVVAWSNTSIESRWVQEEADKGLERNILVPVLIDAVSPPLGFGAIQAQDLINWEPTQPSPEFEKLVVDIAAILGPRTIAAHEEERRKADAEGNRKGKEKDERLKQQRRDRELRTRAWKEKTARLNIWFAAAGVFLLVAGGLWYAWDQSQRRAETEAKVAELGAKQRAEEETQRKEFPSSRGQKTVPEVVVPRGGLFPFPSTETGSQRAANRERTLQAIKEANRGTAEPSNEQARLSENVRPTKVWQGDNPIPDASEVIGEKQANLTQTARPSQASAGDTPSEESGTPDPGEAIDWLLTKRGND